MWQDRLLHCVVFTKTSEEFAPHYLAEIRHDMRQTTISGMIIERLAPHPIIRPHMDDRMGDNINGPSLIRVPDWVEQPLGQYYLYFAHHDGCYIRLAYSDELLGPWTTYRDGVLPLPEARFAGHVASPDVHVDHAQRQ